jgi:hypothetical protein
MVQAPQVRKSLGKSMKVKWSHDAQHNYILNNDTQHNHVQHNDARHI